MVTGDLQGLMELERRLQALEAAVGGGADDRIAALEDHVKELTDVVAAIRNALGGAAQLKSAMSKVPHPPVME